MLSNFFFFVGRWGGGGPKHCIYEKELQYIETGGPF